MAEKIIDPEPKKWWANYLQAKREFANGKISYQEFRAIAVLYRQHIIAYGKVKKKRVDVPSIARLVS